MKNKAFFASESYQTNNQTLNFMRKVVLALFFLAGMNTANAQDRQNAIKINPLSLAIATGNVAYERAVNENQSFQLGGFYSGISLGDVKYTGYGITPEYRFYFGGAKQALNGIYAAPFVRYQNFKFKEKSSSDNISFTSLGGGATIGWEKSWNSGFVLDIFAGPTYGNVKVKSTYDNNDAELLGKLDGFGIRTGITLGFSF
ncbi:MAG TPA: DUF3575 domain-containing protein [Chondromyces sp.]|nr:DUF3575 domain-containing protein [Chondromyces sp.]